MNEEQITTQNDFAPLAEEFFGEGGHLTEKTVYINGGELYVVATPIGRIVDLSLRAIRVLENVDLIAAEDTRRAYILLNMLGVRKEVISNQKFNEFKKTELFIAALKDGKSVAVISDAGTPCISDPGNELIRRAVEEHIKIVPVPGACAAITGLSASGFDLSSFCFRGFFPKENSERRTEIALWRGGAARSFVYYESPKRVRKAVSFFVSEQIPCRLCLCNDLTKTHERFYRGTPAEVLAVLDENPNAEKGEYTLIAEMERDYAKPQKDAALSAEGLLADTMLKMKCDARAAMDALLLSPDCPFRKNELKSAALNLKNLQL